MARRLFTEQRKKRISLGVSLRVIDQIKDLQSFWDLASDCG